MMPETTTERLAALLGLLASLALVVLALTARNERTAVHVAAPAESTAVSAPDATSTQEQGGRPTARPVRSTPAPATTAALVLRAARGDCWLSIRAGTPEGRTLYEGVLTSGRTLRVQGARLWLRMGAATNLDLTLNGKRVTTVAAGTFDVVVTPAGVRPAS